MAETVFIALVVFWLLAAIRLIFAMEPPARYDDYFDHADEDHTGLAPRNRQPDDPGARA